jgi:hypothetical protein
MRTSMITHAKSVALLAALWLALFLCSFAVFLVIQPTGDNFARGLNRMSAFLTWQGAALVVAMLTAVVTRLLGVKAGRNAKLLGYAPLAVNAMLIAMLVAIIAYTVLLKPALPA